MKQLVFDLPQRAAFGRQDFLVSDSNATALGWIERWPDWPSPVLVLHGPRGAGKTHLAHLWRERAAAILLAGASFDKDHLGEIIERCNSPIAVDDADRAAECALLHLYNICLAGGANLLLTARQPPGPWRPALADLGSRLRAAPAVGITLPDDRLLSAVLAKHFADRQVRVAPGVITYLVRHMERSLAAASAIAAALDQAALRQSGSITIPLAHRVLAAAIDDYSPPDSDAGVT